MKGSNSFFNLNYNKLEFLFVNSAVKYVLSRIFYTNVVKFLLLRAGHGIATDFMVP